MERPSACWVVESVMHAQASDRPNLLPVLRFDAQNGKCFMRLKKQTLMKIEPEPSDGTDGRWRWGRLDSRQHTRSYGAGAGTTRWDIIEKDYAESDDGFRRMKPKSVWSDKDDSATRQALWSSKRALDGQLRIRQSKTCDSNSRPLSSKARRRFGHHPRFLFRVQRLLMP